MCSFIFFYFNFRYVTLNVIDIHIYVIRVPIRDGSDEFVLKFILREKEVILNAEN